MPSHPWPRWYAPLGLMALLGSIYLVTLATYDVTNDVQTTSLTSWRIAETGGPWLDGYDYSEWEPGANKLWVAEAANGHVVGFRSPGPVAAGVPAYVVTRLMGAEEYSLIPGSVMASLLTTVALGLMFLALRDRLGDGIAAGAVLALGLTTPVWSVSADALYTHPVTILGIAGMAWAASRDRWWLVGLFGGVALWGRLHTVLIVAVVGLAVAIARRRPRLAIQAGITSGLGLLLAIAWGRWVYGTWSPAGGYSVSGYTERATSTSSPLDSVINQLGLWVAPDRGILVWTPAILLLLPSVVRSWRELPDWSRWLAVSGILYTLVQGQLNGFSGGSSFYGYRLTLELLLCLFPAYALSFPRTGRWARNLLGPLLGLQFAAFSLGASGDGGMLKESEIWTDNSFVHALTVAPVVTVWPILMIVLGAAVGRRLQRRAAVEAPEDDSDVVARDELDRV